MSDKLLQALEEYEETFKDGFPTFQLMANRSEEEIVEMIEKCIEEDKDAYEMGFVELNDDEY